MPMILNEEQNMLKDSAKDFCTNNAPIGQLRELRDKDSAEGFDPTTWNAMVELGWAAIPWAEEHGGLAFGYKGLGVVTEETGRTLTASPLFASVWVGGTVVNIAGSDSQKSEILPKVAAGELLLALALEEGHRHAPYHIETKAEKAGDGFTLTGKKTFVLDGHVANNLIVASRTSGDANARSGITLFLVDREAQGVTVTRTKMADSRNAANVELSGVKVAADAVLGTVDNGAEVLDAALDIARIGLSAEMLGATQEWFFPSVKAPRGKYVL